MKAGIDFGTSLVKAYWRKYDTDFFESSATLGVGGLAAHLAGYGVDELHAVGIGPREGFEAFAVREAEGDPLAAEVALQAKGVWRLRAHDAWPDRFLLVSVGTGTSYTDVEGGNVVATHLGNPMGGGFIAGMGRLFLMGEPAAVGRLARTGTPPDTLMKDRLPALAGSPMGEFVISHFNKANAEMEEADFAAGLVHCVAVSIVRDLMTKDAADVVFTGTSVETYPTLRSSFQRYLGMIGKKAHFPARGEYAGAVGAYHRDD